MRRPSLEAVLLSLGLLLLAGADAGAWWALRYSPLRPVAGMGWHMLRAALSGRHAAATGALRAAGCRFALVTTIGEMLDAMGRDVVGAPARVGAQVPYVVCVPAPAAVPACEDLVAAYRAAVPAPATPVAVQVAGGAHAGGCDGLYDGAGMRLGPIAAAMAGAAGAVRPPPSPLPTPPGAGS